MSASPPTDESPRMSTGIEGLDDVLCGGLPRGRLYLVEGSPGVGKTTLALQFLLAGAAAGERVLYITLSETAEELRAVGESHGWNLDGIDIFELSAVEGQLEPEAQYTLFHPAEVELSGAIQELMGAVEKINPDRVVLDSLSELRLLAQEPLRYRRQILALKQYFNARSCGTLLLDDGSADRADQQTQSVAHGVLEMEHTASDFGSERRRLRVIKLRGVNFRGGYHDFLIKTGGLAVYPRLIAAEHHTPFDRELIPSGVAELDELLGGGLERGTSALLIGPAGAGKSSLANQYVHSCAVKGFTSAIFTFDESRDGLLQRAAGLGLDLREHVASGLLSVQQVDPADLAPAQFAQEVRHVAEVEGARVVVIDSLNGYLHSMPDERFLLVQLHELLTYLGQQGVLTILVIAQHGLLGTSMVAPVDVSYLADSVIMLRYFEARGEIRQAISVLKKRQGTHERSIREFQLSSQGVKVGKPLSEFSGILTGVPVYRGGSPMLPEQPDAGEDPGGSAGH